MEQTVPTIVENLLENEVITLSTTTLERLLSLDSDAFTLYVFYCYTAKKQSIAIKQYTNSIKANETYCKKGLSWGSEKYHKAKNILLKENIIEDLVKRNKEGQVDGHYILIHYLKNHLPQNQRVVSREGGSQAQNHPTSKPEGGFQETNTIDLDLNTIDTNTVKKRKRTVSLPSVATKTARHALVSCTDIELWQVAVDLNISLAAVKAKHAQIMEDIESGYFQRKYKHHVSTYSTLRKWLGMGLEKGQYRQLNEMEKLSLQGDHPEKVAERRRLFALAEEEDED